MNASAASDVRFRSRGRRAARAVRRVAFFGVLWLLVSEGRPELIPAVLAAVLAATAVAAAFGPGSRPRLAGILAYFPGFVWRSIEGGVDVAWRVARPSLPVHPSFVELRLSEGEGAEAARAGGEGAQVLLCNALSLMPGTLGAGLGRGVAVLHLLVDDERVRRMVALEARRVGGLYQPRAPIPDVEITRLG